MVVLGVFLKRTQHGSLFPITKVVIIVLGENKNKKDSAMAASPLWVSEELEYWDSNIRFTHIAATYSELVAISTQGQLHQWRWADAHPYQRADVCFNTYY